MASLPAPPFAFRARVPALPALPSAISVGKGPLSAVFLLKLLLLLLLKPLVEIEGRER